MMAKSVHEKKKRIAHNKSPFETDEMGLDGNDILSSIMGAMKNNHTSVYNSKFENELLQSTKTFSQNKVPIAEIPKTNQNINVPKSRKFGLNNRKFPLMEKTQRTLKQIQHNRKIPKPRAHLAGLSESPLLDDNIVSVEKPKKNKVTVKERNVVKNQNKKVMDEIIPKKIVDATIQNKRTLSESLKKKQNAKEFKYEIASKKNKPKMDKHSAIEESHDLRNNKSDDDDSSDSNFEKFIRKEKKDLPKKPKRQNESRKTPNSKKTNNTSRKRASRTISRTVESDSEVSSEESELPKQYYKNNKRMKNHKVSQDRQSRISVENNSESEMDIVNDEPCNDSSESDELGSASSNNPYSNRLSGEVSNESNSIADSNMSSHQTSAISLMDSNQSTILQTAQSITSMHDQPHATTSSVASTHSFVQAPLPTAVGGGCPDDVQVPLTTIVGSAHSNGLKAPHVTLLVGNAHHHSVLNKAANPVVQNSQPSAVVKREPFSVCDTVNKDKTSINCPTLKLPDESPVIDLTESDTECENVLLPKIVSVSGPKQNELPSYSDESECELVDVVLHESPKKTERSIKNTEPSSSIKNIKTEKVNETVHSCANPRTTINSTAEIAMNTQSTNMISGNSNHSKRTESKENFRNQSSSTAEKPLSSVASNLENSLILNKKVKEEPCDDCIIIDDDDPSTSNSKKITKIQNSNIKKEEDIKRPVSSVRIHNDEKKKLASKEEKLHEVACSNVKNVSTMHDSEPLGNERLSAVDIRSLLESLKKEFSTYKEILQTEQSVEATFKLLERHQAEKLTLLKSQITQCLESSPGNVNSNAIKSAMNLIGTELSSSSSEDSIKVPSNYPPRSDISIQDLQTFATLNMVPLSSISANDIKPDVPQLQRTIKCEKSDVEERDNMSFGEKCIVCNKDASAACQQCAKVFFCSDECGVKYWESGHKNACVK